MALDPFVPQSILVEVSDRVIDGLTIKQKVLYLDLHAPQDPSGLGKVVIDVLVLQYAALPDGGYGRRLTMEGFVDRPRFLTGDNLTLVDRATGVILAIRDPAMTPEDWQAVVDSFPQDTMFQGNYFIWLRDTQQICIGDIIRFHIHQADSMGLFA